jgi:hypothetical protein
VRQVIPFWTWIAAGLLILGLVAIPFCWSPAVSDQAATPTSTPGEVATFTPGPTITSFVVVNTPIPTLMPVTPTSTSTPLPTSTPDILPVTVAPVPTMVRTERPSPAQVPRP